MKNNSQSYKSNSQHRYEGDATKWVYESKLMKETVTYKKELRSTHMSLADLDIVLQRNQLKL